MSDETEESPEEEPEEDESCPVEDFDELNASVLTAMMVDPQTTKAIQLQIINELNESSGALSFFEAMFNGELSLGECPSCQHKNHWLIPEDDLAQMGWVSNQKDARVKRHTTIRDCSQYAEACSKKKTTA